MSNKRTREGEAKGMGLARWWDLTYLSWNKECKPANVQTTGFLHPVLRKIMYTEALGNTGASRQSYARTIGHEIIPQYGRSGEQRLHCLAWHQRQNTKKTQIAKQRTREFRNTESGSAIYSRAVFLRPSSGALPALLCLKRSSPVSPCRSLCSQS